MLNTIFKLENFRLTWWCSRLLAMFIRFWQRLLWGKYIHRKNNNLSLEKIPINRLIIDELYSHGLIAFDAWNYATRFLYPMQNWGLWISHLLLVLGISLILSGIEYFFAFNWTKISLKIKLGSIQLKIIECLGASYFYGLSRLPGKIMLLSASMLLGGPCCIWTNLLNRSWCVQLVYNMDIVYLTLCDFIRICYSMAYLACYQQYLLGPVLESGYAAWARTRNNDHLVPCHFQFGISWVA